MKVTYRIFMVGNVVRESNGILEVDSLEIFYSRLKEKYGVLAEIEITIKAEEDEE